MNQNKIFCRQQGHQQFEVYHICTYKWCSKSRWCCSLCISKKIHDHQISKTHIIKIADLSDKVKYDIEKLKKDYLKSEQAILIKKLLSDLVRDIQELKQNIFQFRQNLERSLNNLISDDDSVNLQSLLNQVEGKDFLQLNDEDINKLMKINGYKFQTNVLLQLQDNLDKIKQQLNRLQQNLKDQQENINNNYEIQKIQQLEEYGKACIFSAAINKKEQYLVYNINDLIYIYDIKMKRICKTIKSKYIQGNCQFTTDSKQLFASNYYGFVYGYFVLNGFKRFYKQKVHQKPIIQIIIQKQHLITNSNDKTIIKTDFIKKTQILKLVGHNNTLKSIDYDISKDIIISTSFYESIKVWDCSNQSILMEYIENNNHRQIQFTNNKQDIICNTYQELWKFTIDYQNKKLVKFLLYKDENRILRFELMNNDQILVICSQYTKILNKRMELSHIFQHTIKLGSCGSNSHLQQLDNPNYIILSDSKLLYYKTSFFNRSITSQELALKYYKIYIYYRKKSIFKLDTFLFFKQIITLED